MRCRITETECLRPHLVCQACDLGKVGHGGLKKTVKPVIPDVVPYVKVGNPSGAPGPGVEIGIKGTF